MIGSRPTAGAGRGGNPFAAGRGMPMRGGINRGAPRGGMARGGSRFAAPQAQFAAPPLPGMESSNQPSDHQNKPFAESSGSVDQIHPKPLATPPPSSKVEASSNNQAISLDFLDELATPP